jgi:hypothetical protein
MTNNSRLLEVLAPLAAQSADHLRIHTAIIDGNHDRACSLIVGRMIDALQGLLVYPPPNELPIWWACLARCRARG